MGGKKSAKKAPPKKVRAVLCWQSSTYLTVTQAKPKLDTKFTCPFCSHDGSCSVVM